MRDVRRPCPVCSTPHRRDCLDACAACGLEALAVLPAQVWPPPRLAADRPALGVAVSHTPPPRSDSLYRDAPPTAELRAVVTSEQGWTLLIPMVMFGGPFLVIGAVGLASCSVQAAAEFVRGGMLVALVYALGAALSLAGLAVGVGAVYTLASIATRRTTLEFVGPALRIEERRFLIWRRVTHLDRARVASVALGGYQREATRVLLLLRDGGAVCVKTSSIAADAESLAASLARAIDAAPAGA